MLKGTVSQLLAQNVKFNGRTVNAAQLSVIAAVFGTSLGNAPRDKGPGKPATLWEFPDQLAIAVTVDAAQPTPTAEDVAGDAPASEPAIPEPAALPEAA